MPNYDFSKDLPIAVNTENEIAVFLTEKYGCTILRHSHSGDYDLLVSHKGKTIAIEIKEDFTCQKTGNVGLEFECRGKPSGIQTTEAGLFIYKIHKQEEIVYVEILTSTLKKMIADKVYFRIVNGGDKGSNSMNYLFKYDAFVANGKIIRKVPLDKK